MAADLAVTLADGGETIGDLAVLREQPGLFEKVASSVMAWQHYFLEPVVVEVGAVPGLTGPHLVES